MSTKAPSKPLCCVSIGYYDYLMPMDKGLKIVEIMSHALACTREFVGGKHGTMYRVEGPVSVTYSSVEPNQVLPPKSDQPGCPPQRALTLELPKLEGRK